MRDNTSRDFFFFFVFFFFQGNSNFFSGKSKKFSNGEIFKKLIFLKHFLVETQKKSDGQKSADLGPCPTTSGEKHFSSKGEKTGKTKIRRNQENIFQNLENSFIFL